VIVDAVRTPLGKRDGKLRDWHPVDLASEMLIALQQRQIELLTALLAPQDRPG